MVGMYVRVRIANNNIIDNNEDILYFLGDDSTRQSTIIIFAYIVQVPLSTDIIISERAVSNSSGVDLASDSSNREQFSRILFLFCYCVVIISSQD